MVTRNKLVYEILEHIREEIKDDEPVSIRQLEEYVKDYRADILKQRMERDPFSVDDSCIQTITGLNVIKVDSSNIGGFSTNKYLMRTDSKVPSTIKRRGEVGSLLYIGNADMLGRSYSIKTYTSAIESGYGRFNYSEIFAFPYGDCIYLTSKSSDVKAIYHLTVRGVFSDPQEAYMADANVPDDYIYTGDENYYTSQELKRYIIQSILQEKFNIIIDQPSDKVDDGVHNLE